ncbi:MAG: DUF3943 domain-containing protein [Paludibacter sp.]
MHFNRNSLITLCFALALSVQVEAQTEVNTDSLLIKKPGNTLSEMARKPLLASGIITATNLGVWAYDWYLMKEFWADINLQTINRNFKTGFVWDNDMFITNLLSHPYNGGLYYNAARNNGLSFWQSIPFTAGGSLFWEFFLENEAASINDFATTSVGGPCVGEITYRVSDLFIDDRTVGFERFKREALLTIISPIRGLNRLLNGDAFKHRTIKGNSVTTPAFSFYSSLGYRMMSDNSHIGGTPAYMPSYNIGLVYGDAFDPDLEKPYDFFSVQLSGNFATIESLMSRANILGLLYHNDIVLRKTGSQLRFGIFQHINYYDGQADLKNVSIKPFKIAEAASFGLGLLFKSKLSNEFLFSGAAHLGGILMGGSQTDYFSFYSRDYSMGSGFSSKLNMELEFRSRVKLSLSSEDYRIYSWTGINPTDKSIVQNVQGDVCSSSLDVLRANFRYIIAKHFLLSAETSYYYRRNIYKYFPNVIHGVWGNTLSLGYTF